MIVFWTFAKSAVFPIIVVSKKKNNIYKYNYFIIQQLILLFRWIKLIKSDSKGICHFIKDLHFKCSFDLTIYPVEETTKNRTTVFNIDQKYYVWIPELTASQHSRMIFEGACEDWSNYAENSPLNHRNTFK